jgi:hypothetical protein
MTITINLLPEETARLAAEARQGGLSLEGYVHQRLTGGERPSKRDIMELQGLGKEIWQGVDARQYVNDLRDDRE